MLATLCHNPGVDADRLILNDLVERPQHLLDGARRIGELLA